MKIVVCAKVIQNELNVFDAAALECALRLSDDVTVLTMGPPSAEEVLKRVTRLGAKAVLLTDPAFAGADTLATAYTLSCALKQITYDCILCGRQSTDGDTAQTGPCLTAMLGLPLLANVMELPKVGETVTAVTREGEQTEHLPLLMTVERICDLRFPSIRSKPSEVTVWNLKDISADPSKCGLAGSPTRVLQVFENHLGERKCSFIQMEELEPLVQKLLAQEHEAKQTPLSSCGLDSVYTIGNEVEAFARSIARRVVCLPKDSAEQIARLVREKQIKVLLWNADLWGRRTAPMVAAMLETGLCADVVQLETDGKKLYMYRPARGGDVTAKIECRTEPVMATLRTVESASDILVSGGRGMAGSMDKLREFAKSFGAELGASRALVDMGLMPYAAQIGLTGRSVSPKVYIAVGISGAVQHTCAIENTGTIIAINPDRNARIFQYADYGIATAF